MIPKNKNRRAAFRRKRGAILAASIAALCSLHLFPSHAHAQTLYLGEQGGAVAEYNLSTGALMNANFITGLNNPQNLAILGNGIFVSNLGGGSGTTVGQYNLITGAPINPSFITGLNGPWGVAASGNTLFVANWNSGIAGVGSVGTYNATTGAPINPSFITGLNTPSTVAIYGNTLFVANSGGQHGGGTTVGAYNATTGAPINTQLLTGLNGPFGIALQGNILYVSNWNVGTVGEYNATTGAVINASFIAGLSGPEALALSGNMLLVSNQQGTTVGEYNATTGAVINASFISGVTGPDGLAIYTATNNMSINALGPNPIGGGTTLDLIINSLGTSGPVPIASATTNINTLTQAFTTAATIDTSPGTLRVGINGGIFITQGSAALTIGAAPNSGILTAGGNTSNVAGNLLLQNNSTSLLTINSTVTDNGTGVVSVTVAGTGKIVLAGTNTYSGGTLISGGTVLFNSLANFGAGLITLNGGGLQWTGGAPIDISGRLAPIGPTGANFNTNGTDLTFASPLSGPGGVIKSGAGSLTLMGANSYTGNTVVNQGALYVDGSIASPTTAVDSGATLAGFGMIGGSVVNGGIVAPGDAPGTLTISGNYTQSPTGTLQIRVGGLAALQHDLLAVTGTATLAGTLQLIQLNGFRFSGLGQSVTFLTASGGISGTFSSVINPFSAGSGFGAKVIYSAKSVSLESIQESIASTVTSNNGTPNDLSVAKAIDASASDPRNARLISYLDSLSPANLLRALELIEPAQITSVYQVAIAQSQVQLSNLDRRLEDVRSGSNGFNSARFSMTGPALSGAAFSGPTGDGGLLQGPDGKSGKSDTSMAMAPNPNNSWGVFITGSGEWANVGDTSSARGYDLTDAGITLGLDFKATEHLAIGLGLGYDQTNVDLANSGRVTVNGGKLALYGTYFTEKGFYADFVVQGGYDSYDSHRPALFGTARSTTDGGELNVLFGTGYEFKSGAWTYGPTANFKYIYAGFDSFTEDGSLAPLRFPSQHEESITTAFGAKASYDWKIGNVRVRPEVRVRWQHEYSDNTLSLDAGFANGAGPDFTVHGPAIGRDSMLVGAGFAIQWNERFSSNVYYDGELLRTNYQASNITGGFRYEF